MRAVFVIALFLFPFLKILAQPVGATINNPINAGTLNPGSTFTDTKNNAPANGYQNNMGQPSDDIYYKFVITSSAVVSMSHCASTFDTYMYLLDGSGTIIDFKDDDGPLCPSTLQSSIKRSLTPGTYYVVSEGYSSYYGNITLSISIPSASTEVLTDFSQQMTQVFSSLETSRVPYGLLLDIGMEQTNLSKYNGSVLVDSNYVDDGDFHTIYSTLTSTQISSAASNFRPVPLLDSLSFKERLPGKIILNGLFYRYSRFKDNAVQNNQITVANNKVYDKYVSGVWQSPYQVETVFAVTAASARIVGKNQQILLPSSLWLTNDGSTVSNLNIDAGDGLGYRLINPGQALTVSYPDTGMKVLNYKLNLTSGATLLSHSYLHVEGNTVDDHPRRIVYPITATTPFGTTYIAAKMTIEYANADLKLRRPLIVAEAYDAGIVTQPESEFGENGIEEFLKDVSDDNATELRRILVDVPLYDIVYVDWSNGTDDIKKNALLLEKVIRDVNTRKAQAGSTLKNVVLGQSMGGLIARWALKDMENNNENHQTSLYISHDSPHLGVNVPIGFQYMLKHFKNMYLNHPLAVAGAETFQFFAGGASPYKQLTVLDRMATRQMLINYVNNEYKIDNLIHNQWQSELKTMGYPQGVPGTLFRKISISNGAQCSNSQNLLPDGSLVSFLGKANTRFLGDVAVSVLMKFMPAWMLGPVGIAAKPLISLPGRNDIKVELYINAISDNGGNRVYYNKISYTKKVLWLIPITINLSNKSFFSEPGMLPFDSFAGGWFKVPYTLNNSSDHNWFYKYNIVASTAYSFGHVPIASALDIGGGNVALTRADYERRYLATAPPAAPKNTPFQNFTTGILNVAVNEPHITFTAPNANWLATELNNAQQQTAGAAPADCTYFCGSNQISGPDAYCSNTTYSLPNLPSNFTVQWSTTGNISISGSSTGSSVTISGTYGNGVISARVTSPACSPATFSKSLIFTYLDYTTTYDRTPQSSNYQYVSFTATQIPGTIPTNYQWYKEETNGSLTPISQGYQLNNYPIPPCSAVYFTLKVTTPCGILSARPYGYNTTCPSAMTSTQSFAAFPNPASNELIISNQTKDKKESKDTFNQTESDDYEVILYDEKGKRIRAIKNNKQKDVMLDTSDIPNGTYFLHIIRGKEIEKKQIIIKH